MGCPVCHWTLSRHVGDPPRMTRHTLFQVPQQTSKCLNRQIQPLEPRIFNFSRNRRRKKGTGRVGKFHSYFLRRNLRAAPYQERCCDTATLSHHAATAATRILVISCSEDGASYKFFSIDQGLNPGFLHCFKANNKQIRNCFNVKNEELKNVSDAPWSH